MSVVFLVTWVCDERAKNLKEFESLEGYEFENAMDKVTSALKIFGGPYILGSKVGVDNRILSSSECKELAHEFGLPMNVVILLNWVCKCGS